MILLYRPSLDFSSGAGQLMRMQLRALRDAGERAEIGCERGALKFWLRSGARARRIPLRAARDAAAARFVVDHGLCVPKAAVVFVHNLATEASVHLPRQDWAAQAEAERTFFADLRADALLVANSRLVADALCARFRAAPERVVVQHPGYQAARFNPSRAAELRASARRELGVAPDAPVIGLITSGDFEKRGLDVFVAAAERITAGRPDARFLVVGSKSLPTGVRGHALAGTGRLLYRPKSRTPERWFSALDLFLYPALFEEFGMVVLEAQAWGCRRDVSTESGRGVPAVGLRALASGSSARGRTRGARARAARRRRRSGELSAAGIANAPAYDDRAYARASAATILVQKRWLK